MEKLGSTWQVSTENLCARSAFALSRIFSSDGPKEAPSASYRTEKTPTLSMEVYIGSYGIIWEN